jgi:YYY domain-containing protein
LTPLAGAGPLLLDDDERERYGVAGTWHELFDPSSLANELPLLVWGAALVLLGLIAFPYLWLALRRLPDAGFAIARPVGLLLVAWPAWWLASLEVAEFGRASLAATAALLAAGAVAIAVAHRRELARWLRARRKVLIAAELVFWTVFGAFLAVRWANPDLWHPSLGGEKPMDLAYLNAVVKSAEFPPYDPWFAGGYVNYYYFGFVLVAALVELTAIVPDVAYNLAVPTLAACLASATFGAVLALVARRRPPRGRTLTTAALGAAFVAVAGNLGEVEVVVDHLRGGVPLDWWYWNASRAITAPAGEPGPITEFPAFTYLYADLHAHAIALPFTVVVLVLSVALATGAASRRLAAYGLLALALGALWPTNTWDLPTYALVTLLVLTLGGVAAGRIRGAVRALAAWFAVAGAAYALYLPFHLSYESAFAGVARWRGGRTSLVDYVTVHGLFLFVVVSALVLDLLLAPDLGASAPGLIVAVGALLAATAVRQTRDVGRDIRVALVAVALALTLAVEVFVVDRIDIGRTNTVFKTYLQVWVLWGVAAAASLPLIYEHLRRLRLPWRLAWRAAFVVLLAAALLYPALAAPAKVRDRFDRSVGPTLDGTAFMAKAVHVDRDVAMPLADDLAALRWLRENAEGSPVIAEVNTAPTLYGWGNRFAMFTGNPAVVGWDFHQRQQRGEFQHDEILRRIEDVQELYGTADAAAAHRILRRYGASYVVVGRLERAYFPDGAAKWSTGEGRLWETAYRNAGATIYRVLAG